jgi:hypothetical protein
MERARNIAKQIEQQEGSECGVVLYFNELLI